MHSLRERSKLPRHLFLTFVVLVICVGVGANLLYRHFFVLAKTKEAATLESVARLQANQVSRWRSGWLYSLGFSSKDPMREEIEEYISDPRHGVIENKMLNWIRTLQKEGSVKGVVLMDAGGGILLSEGAAVNQLHFPAGELLREVVNSQAAAFTDLHAHPQSGEAEMELITPLFSQITSPHRPLGYLVLCLDPNRELFPIVDQWPIPTSTGQSFLVRRNGETVIFLNEHRHQKGVALKAIVPNKNDNSLAAIAARGTEGTVEGQDLDRDKLLATVHPIPNSDWLLLAKIDTKEAYADVSRFARAVVLGVSLVILLVASVISLLWRQQRVQQLRAAYEKERERAALIEASPGIIAIVDPENRFTWLNKVGLDFFGSEAIGKSFHEFILSEAERFICQVKTRPIWEGSKEKVELDLWQRRADGGERLIAWHCKPLHNEAGRVISTLSVGHDITERKQAEVALRESEARFRAIFEASAIGVTRVDVHGRLVESNPALQEMLGYTGEELGSKVFANLLHPDDATADWDLFRELIEGKRDHYQREQRFYRKDGDLLWGRLTCSLVRVLSSEPPFAIGMLENITEHKKLEVELAESEGKYRSLVNDSLVGVYLFQDGLLRFVNPKLAEIFGYTVEELVDKKAPVDLVYPEDRPLFEKQVNRRLSGEIQSLDYTSRGLKKDGTVFDVEVYGSRTLFRGQPAIQGTLLDISERKTLQAQLVQAQKMESLGTMAGGIAHDFNNILTGILGFNEMALTRLPKDDPLRSHLARIQSLGQRAVELIKKILLFSRKQKPDMQEIDLSRTIEAFVPFLRRVVEENVEIEVSCDPALPLIFADPLLLHQVLMNLCVNARDAMPSGGTLRIETLLRSVDEVYVSQHADAREGRFAVLSIADTGAGMSATVLKRIFDPFFTTKEAGKGTGLGLAVCFGIVKEHGGWIDVSSEQNRGTSIQIFLPVRGVETTHPPVPQEETRIPEGSGEWILVVDDEVQLCDLAQAILKQLNYQVLVAQNGKDAISLYRDHRDQVSLVLTDMVMPKGGGSNLAREIRAINPSVPIIFCSGYSFNAPSSSFLQEERVDFLPKPYTPIQLARKIHRLLHLQ